MDVILNNARFILDDEIHLGSLTIKDGTITDIAGLSSNLDAIDCGGDIIAPGMIELHTDNLEKHYLPRPGVFWPDYLGAFVAHDRHMLTSGVTTVYDSLRSYDSSCDSQRFDTIFASTFKAIEDGKTNNVLYCDHYIHIRCEVSEPNMFDHISPFLEEDLVRLVSIMDHTPGQRQFRNLDKLHQYNTGRGMSVAESEKRIAERMEMGTKNVADNTMAVLQKCQDLQIPIASHDDTTADHVIEAKSYGVCISEFPTTLEAAVEAHRQGLVTVMGAPNIVRGGSHSGNVPASALFEQSLLDILSSDYNPNSLIQAVFCLSEQYNVPLYETFKLVCQNPAKAAGFTDRGVIQIGKRADLICIHQVGRTPIIRKAWVAGKGIF